MIWFWEAVFIISLDNGKFEVQKIVDIFSNFCFVFFIIVTMVLGCSIRASRIENMPQIGPLSELKNRH